MHQILDDIKYKFTNIFSDVRYKVQDLWSDPKGRIKLVGGSALGAVAFVLLAVQTARWLTPPPPPPGGIQAASTSWVEPDSWVAKARSALEGNDALAGVSITETGRGDNKGVRVRGTVPDMPARMECMRLLGELGVPENLEMDVKVDPASIKPRP